MRDKKLWPMINDERLKNRKRLRRKTTKRCCFKEEI